MGLPGRLVYQAYQYFWSGFDWLYPPRCAGCGKAGKRWCDHCMASVQVITPPVCPICGEKQSADQVCARCALSAHSYVAVRSWAAYAGPLRKAIQRLKYHRDVAVGEILSRPMLACLKNLGWSFDMIVPVPVSLARLAERGYNQVSLLARPIALGLERPYYYLALKKERETRSQVGLPAKERQVNVQGAFGADRKVVKGKTVLVIDDIATTGSTLEECARALVKAGADQVYGFTLARSMVLDQS
jgi:competence protein ComFC